MKKILIVIMLMFLISGCKKLESTDSENKKYYSLIKELSKVNKSSDSIPFEINITVRDLIDNELIYRVYIDNVKENIYDIETIAIHNLPTEDIFPTSGVFDNKVDLLIDKKENSSKGIILGGYIEYKNNFNATFKVLVKYKNNKNKSNTIYYIKQYTTNK